MAVTAARVACGLVVVLGSSPAWAWGHDGHHIVNRLAAQALPPEVPAFLRSPAAVDAIDYLAPEPDRWHGAAEPELHADESPDHFIGLELADRIGNLPRDRYALIQAEQAAALSPATVGFQPWATQDSWQRLKADFREYRALVAAHVPTAPAELAIIYDAAILGHYVGDGAQPLHTTVQYNGWTGPNPRRFTTAHHIHAAFESDYVAANIRREQVATLVAASRPTAVDDEWHQYLGFLRASHALVEQVYALEQAGGFAAAGTPEARAFTNQRLAAGAIELRDLIYTAWLRSADPM